VAEQQGFAVPARISSAIHIVIEVLDLSHGLALQKAPQLYKNTSCAILNNEFKNSGG